MATTSSMNDWASEIAKYVAETRAGVMGGGGMTDPKTGGMAGGGMAGAGSAFFAGVPGGAGGGSFHMEPVDLPDAPEGPSYGKLNKSWKSARNMDELDAVMKDYDDLEASTKAAGWQAASNAGNTYAARLMQAGINPLASGVVESQARLPVYKELASIAKDKSATRLDAVSRAEALAAQIAGQIANIQLGYANTLANYNSQMAGYEIDMSQFNAKQDLAAAGLAMQYDSRGGSSGSSGGGGGAVSTGYLGAAPYGTVGLNSYIGNSGPLSSRSPLNTGNYVSNSGLVGTATDQNTAVVGIGGPGTRMGADFYTPPSTAGKTASASKSTAGSGDMPDWYKQYIS